MVRRRHRDFFSLDFIPMGVPEKVHIDFRRESDIPWRSDAGILIADPVF